MPTLEQRSQGSPIQALAPRKSLPQWINQIQHTEVTFRLSALKMMVRLSHS